LRLLSSFDWTFSPMVIDINNDFNLKDEKEINVSSLSSSFHLFNQSPSP
jgi:U3 small nucleolar RNA-associated protein 22